MQRRAFHMYLRQVLQCFFRGSRFAYSFRNWGHVVSLRICQVGLRSSPSTYCFNSWCLRPGVNHRPMLVCRSFLHRVSCYFLRRSFVRCLSSCLKNCAFVPSVIRSFCHSFLLSFVPSVLPSLCPLFVSSLLSSIVPSFCRSPHMECVHQSVTFSR